MFFLLENLKLLVLTQQCNFIKSFLNNTKPECVCKVFYP